MKLDADNETLAENKVLILYLLAIISKPINNDELYRLVLSIQDINYFYFQQFLLDLEENKYSSINFPNFFLLLFRHFTVSISW